MISSSSTRHRSRVSTIHYVPCQVLIHYHNCRPLKSESQSAHLPSCSKPYKRLQALQKSSIDHAYIGGFTLSLLGSQRPTQICYDLCDSEGGRGGIPADMTSCTIMIKVENIEALRDQLPELDPHFAPTEFKSSMYLKSVQEKKANPPTRVVIVSRANIASS
jgi:hypothetical protein